MENIIGFAFDLEGNGINIENLHWGSHILTARRLGVEIRNHQEMFGILPHSIGGPDKEVCREIKELADSRLSIEEITAIDIAFYREKFNLIEDFNPCIREGFLKFLTRLQRLRIPMAIGSLSRDEEANRIIENSELKNFFDPSRRILLSHVSKTKPHPEVYLKTAEAMGVDPRYQIVSDDSPRGIIAGVEAGSLAFGMPINWAGNTIAQLIDAGAVAIYKSWLQVNPEAMIEYATKHAR